MYHVCIDLIRVYDCISSEEYKFQRCVNTTAYKRIRSFLRSPFEATPTKRQGLLFALSLSPFTDTIIGHASLSLCNVIPYAFIRTYPHDKHRIVIDICPYRSKGSGIIRPSNNVVGGEYRDHRDNVASFPDHNCELCFLVFTRDMYL